MGITTPLLHADNLFSSNAYSSNAPADTLEGEAHDDEFLAVEQAYQLNVELEQNQLLLIWQIADAYYLYGHRFKFQLLNNDQPIPINPQLPKGKKKFDDYFGEVEVFYHQALVSIPLPAQSDEESLQLEVSSQGCADAGLCYPPYKQRFDIDRKKLIATEISHTESPQRSNIVTPGANIDGNDTGNNTSNGTDKISDSDEPSLLYILLLAAIGGAILNLMPCVFPVLTLKVLSFTGQDPAQAHTRTHGLVYTAGVVLSFIAVASILLLLKATGEAIGWGFHLQSPWFVAALTYLFFVMGLALSGMLELGSRFMGVGGAMAAQGGYTGTFFTGVLATVVASPCTAPFMGTALGYAMTQPPVIALSVFAALGFGMAFPFLLLSEIPSLTRFMPKPGAWMDSFKRFMAFPLYATCVWLLWVIGNQTGSSGMAIVLLGCLLIALAIYLWHESASKHRWQVLKNITSLIATVAALMMLASPFLQPRSQAMTAPENAQWQTYSATTLQDLQNSGQAVFINVTADWCITCLLNERTTLSTDEIEQAFKNNNIHYLKADWTKHDPAITDLLHQYERSGIPLYLLYPPGKPQQAIILPQILTKNIILQALENM